MPANSARKAWLPSWRPSTSTGISPQTKKTGGIPISTSESKHAYFNPDQAEDIFGLPYLDLIAQVENHTLAVQQWLPSRAPQVTSYQGFGVAAYSNGIPARLFNQALGAHYAGRDTRHIEIDVRTVQAFFASRDVPWMWWIGPSTPDAVRHQIEGHGLVNFSDLPAMAAPLPPPDLAPSSDDLKVYQAAALDDLKAASHIRRTAFRFSEGVGLTYFEDCPADWLENEMAYLYLVQQGDDPPAAIGALIIAEGIPGIYVMATLPDHERRGMGKAALHHMLVQAADMGHTMIALTASPKGFGLYQKLGFEYLFDFKLYDMS